MLPGARRRPTHSGKQITTVRVSWRRRLANPALAFMGSHREELGSFLLHMFTPAMRTVGIFLVVLVQSKNDFEGLMTIEANIIVDGHGDPPVDTSTELYAYGKIVDC